MKNKETNINKHYKLCLFYLSDIAAHANKMGKKGKMIEGMAVSEATQLTMFLK